MLLNYKVITNANHKEWLVFLHGLGGNHNIFYKQLDYFSTKFNLLLIDLPGHGESMSTLKHGTLDMTIEKVNQLLTHLSIKDAHFMAVSLGTIIAQEFSILYPSKVKSMVLAGAVDKWKNWGYSVANIALTFPIKQLFPYMWEYQLFAYVLMPKNNHKKSRDIFIKEAKKLGKEDYYNWVKIGKSSHRTYKKLKFTNNKIPKLYISGEEDHMFLPGLRSYVASEKNVEINVLKKCGHVCNIEKAEVFNQLSMDFLKKHMSEKI